MTIRLRPLPAICCDSGDMDEGPHPGCAEFEAPVWHKCRRPATYTAKIPPDQFWPLSMRMRLCNGHRQELQHHVPEARVYRFRHIR